MLAADFAENQLDVILLLVALGFFGVALYLLGVVRNVPAAIVSAVIGAILLVVLFGD